MFDALSDRLRNALSGLTGHGRISEADVDAAMREIRLALLEADVNFKVVKDFVARVKARAVGADVADARAKAYEGIASISFEGAQWRRDIAAEPLGVVEGAAAL